MDRPFIERLYIQNYGCIQDATFTLTPLHALLGPNDSGKSTVLRALRTLAYLRMPNLKQGERDSLYRALIANSEKGAARIDASTSVKTWRIDFHPRQGVALELPDKDRDDTRVIGILSSIDFYNNPSQLSYLLPRDLQQALAGSLLVRLDPEALRAPHALIPDGQPLRFVDEKGTGLPAIYDALMVRDLPAFLQLNQDLSRVFPNVKSISLTNPNEGQKALGVKLVDGGFIPAEFMSEGLLYYLAFAAIPHLDPAALLLIEEPENGLNPARIAEVMRLLRGISKTIQVLIATHSPFVTSELQANEVTVVSRTREHGTRATLMRDAPRFDERARASALGELGVSYANGDGEGPRLPPPPPARGPRP